MIDKGAPPLNRLLKVTTYLYGRGVLCAARRSYRSEPGAIRTKALPAVQLLALQKGFQVAPLESKPFLGRVIGRCKAFGTSVGRAALKPKKGLEPFPYFCISFSIWPASNKIINIKKGRSIA